MAEQRPRLPIHRGLVAERKARLQEIKQRNESPRRVSQTTLTDNQFNPDGREFRTAFGTPTTVRSSPRRSRTSLISSYVSNEDIADRIRRKRSAVTISGPTVTPKHSAAIIHWRPPTPFAHQIKTADIDSVSVSTGPTDTTSEFKLYQPAPQSNRSRLADGLESRISDVPTGRDGSSVAPSDSDFARVLSLAIDDELATEPYQPHIQILDRSISQATLRAYLPTSPSETAQVAQSEGAQISRSETDTIGTAGRSKRGKIKGLLKGVVHGQGETESIVSGKSKLRRMFSGRHARIASDPLTDSDISSSENGDLTTEYASMRVLVSKCKAAHEQVEVLDESGGAVAVLMVTSAGWQLASGSKIKGTSGRCYVCAGGS